MDYNQHHGYMRPPPPPSTADPYQRPPPPPPSNQPWPYPPSQFQYQPQPQHSPSPPPSQWPPPHSADHAQYPPHPPPPPAYHAHQPPPYPPLPHYLPPQQLPPRPPQVPQPYSQDWGSGSWSHRPSWEYPSSAPAANKNEEDWAAKARAWAAAKAATDSRHPTSQFVPAGRPEDQNHFHDQYSQSVDPQFIDVHKPLAPASNYQQHPVGQPNRTGLGQVQDSQYVSPGQPSYAADMHMPLAARDGSLARDSVALFPQQEKSSTNPLVHQQEVPSSYSSVAGNEQAGDRYEKFNSASLPVAPLSQHPVQPLPPAGWMEEPHHLSGSRPAESVTDLSDQPLNFAPHFNRDLDPHMQPNYAHSSGGPARGVDPSVAISSNYAWAPSSAPGTVYPSVPPTIPSGPQAEHPIAMPSPASGHSAPMFPTGPGFPPNVPMMGAAFGVGTGVPPHPTAFSGDTYSVSERPKKASVPNWLREEIIKSKAVITSSGPGIPKEDSQSFEEDSNDKSSRKGDQADSKSIDSSRSTEDEDEDEDEVEAARTAAINQEIKRVLTEVLLKVTDELFDEIATKVLKEDDLSVEVGRDSDMSNHQIASSTPSILTPKALAKVMIPTKTKERDDDDASEKSTSGSPGDILGLGSYVSDEDDEDIQSSGKLNVKESSTHKQSSSSKHLEGNPVIENGSSWEETEEQKNIPAKLETDGNGRKSPVSSIRNSSVANTELNDNRAARELDPTDDRRSSKRLSGIAEDESQHDSDISMLNKSLTGKAVERNEVPDGNLDPRRLTNDDSRIQNTGSRSDNSDRHENKKSSIKKDHKEPESSKDRVDGKGDEEHRRHEERRTKTEKLDYHDNLRDKGKEKGRTDEKVKNSESRKRPSPSSGKEGTTETRKDKRTIGKEDSDEKRQDRTRDEKKERSRHKSGSESSRHKRRRSSSLGVRGGRESKDTSVVSRANDTSDESSDDSKRKSHNSRRRKSPSPIRSRKRHVSRSPHSKHSKRRHSPYSSLEASRGRRSPSRSRSRSRSPVHRRR